MTLLKGQWMWLSLLILPSAAAFSIYFLYRLDDSKLRRSLQLAILLSLAAHLLVMIVASMTDIFNNDFHQNKTEVAKRQPRTITVRKKNSNFVWEKPNMRETPEKEVRPEKVETTTQKKPQTIPVPENKPTPQPQITKRKTTRSSVPRLDKQLSQRRRQSQPASPALSAKASPKKTNPQQRPQKQTAASSAASAANSASQTKKQSSPSASAARSQPSNSTPSKSQSSVQNQITRSRASSEKSEPSIQPSKPNRRMSRSTARIRRRIPLISKQETRKSPTQKTEPTRSTVKTPSKSSSEVTRRQVQRKLNPTRTNQPRTMASPRTSVAKTRIRQERQPPAITSKTSRSRVARRSTRVAAVPTTTQSIESPSRNPKSSTRSQTIQPRALAISRGQQGIAGAIKESNLQQKTGGRTSPAPRASDSARRRQSVSTPSPQQLLTPMQAATVRQTRSQAATPSTTLKATTTTPSTVTASRNQSEQTLRASAAANQVASRAPAAEFAAQAGETEIDLGPTKIVASSTNARERSGGGAADPGQFTEQESSRISRTSAESTPTLSAQTAVQTAAQTTPESRESGETDSTPNARAVVHAREGATRPDSYDRASAETTGPLSDFGSTAREMSQLADSRNRASSDAPATAGEADDDEDERMRRGRRNTQLAQSPSLSRKIEVGNGDAQGTTSTSGKSAATNNAATTGDGSTQLTESSGTNQIKKSVAGTVGGTFARGAAVGLLQTAAALPLTDFSADGNGKPRERQNSQSNQNLASAESDSTSRVRQTASTGELPQLSQTGSTPGTGMANLKSQRSSADSNGLTASELSAQRASRSTGGARLEIAAMEGPAGLGDTPAPAIGVPNRPATRDSDQLMPDFQQRFRTTQAGGTPSFNPDAFTAKRAFRSRQGGDSRSSAPSTEASIELGLEFLARNQKEDGSWSLEGFDRGHRIHDDYQLNSDSAATGLAVLAFQGAGYTHKEFKYAELLDRALKSLIENQNRNGCLYKDSKTKSDDFCRMYSHAIATLALCEAYGMTRDPELKKPTLKALGWITDTQDPDKGGWRYHAELTRRKSDTSVTGWMLMALQSARLAELEVDPKTLEGIEKWLDLAVDNQPHLYRYNPYSIDTETDNRSGNRKPTPSMTAVGLLMKIYTDKGKNNELLESGVRYMLDNQLPGDQNSMARDTYYWYYATQVIKHVDGEQWETWNGRLHPLLGRTQIKTGEMAGSWHPYDPVPDKWGLHAGRLYVTTMNLLSLEVRYRLLPLYEETLD